MKCNIDKQEAIFVGIDPSITGTGIVVLDQDKCIIKQILVKTTTKDIIEERLVKIKNSLRFIPNIYRLKSVYIEGPSYGSKGNAVLQMGSLHFLIRIFLYERNVDFKVISPKTLKVFHCGNGNAKKNEVLFLVEKTLGVSFKDHNIADAYGLACMALRDYNEKS
jgi:crossover junction endodeoxyribonuclease RuvC